MKQQMIGTVLALTLGASLNAHAALMSNINVSGDFALTGFNPFIDTDSNPYTYSFLGSNLVGNANITIPQTNQDVTWTATGAVNAVAGPLSVLPSIIFENFLLGQTSSGAGSITPGTYAYDFTNQNYSTTSGNFQLAVPSIPGALIGSPVDFSMNSFLDVTYDIFAQQADNVVNDILLSFNEKPTNPLINVSSIINLFDQLPTSGQLGSIDGDFSVDLAFKGEVNNASVHEPATFGLLGLGLAGLLSRRRKSV